MNPEEQKNLEDLAAALDGHEVTDEEGQLSGENDTPDEDTADSESKTTEEDSVKAEKPSDDASDDAQSDDDDDTDQLAEDDSGKRYVPEDRFKKVYAKMKELERKTLEEERAREQGDALLRQIEGKKTGKKQEQSDQGPRVPDKADVLELKMELPQFDPKKEDYSPQLDRLGYQIYKANPGMSLVDAGKEAINMAKQFAKTTAEAQAKARAVKSLQSDQGITGRRQSTGNTTPDPDNMNLEEMEAFLKQSGQW